MMTAEERTLPVGWKWAQVKEICARIDYGFTTSADFGVAEPRFLRITDIQNGYVDWDAVPGCHISKKEEDANRLSDGDIVFARTGGTTGKSFLIKNPPRAVFASYLIRLRPSNNVLADYLYAYFQGEAYWQQVKARVRGGAQPNVNASLLGEITLPLPPLPEQKRIAAILTEQLAAVDRARAAAEAQMDLSLQLIEAYLHQSLATPVCSLSLRDCLIEVSKGVGASWSDYPLLGVSRAGIAPAKEAIGKQPERYKLVDAETIFYNPMRILLGSIALVDTKDAPGIASPDYVILKTRHGILHHRWFYYWLRSTYGETFIKTLAKGAVRERMMFSRLAQASIEVPAWNVQVEVAERLKKVLALRHAVTAQLDSINQLPSTLLRQAFAGKI